MLVQCHNCGAPLDVAEGVTSLRCHYCGTTAEVAQFRTVAQETPQGFAPPPQWTPPIDSSLPQIPLDYRPRQAVKATVRALLFSTLLALGLGGFILWRVSSAMQQAMGSSSLSDLAQNGLNQAVNAVNGAAVGSRVPVVCSGNDDVTLNGKSLVLTSGTPVIASANCTIRLIGCTVTGATAIIARNNASVIVQGGTISASGPAVLLTDNASLDVSGGALLRGESTITATNNARAVVHGASVSARHVAVHATGGATVDTQGSTIQGEIVEPRRAHK